MALKDILGRIDSETEAEVAKILSAAREEADRSLEAARSVARGLAEDRLAKATKAAEQEAAAMVAAARIRARDRLIAEKRVYLERALREAVARIESGNEGEYASLLCTRAIPLLRGNESVEVGAGEPGSVRDSIARTLAEAGLDHIEVGVTDQVDKGLLLRGERMYVEVSANTIVNEARSHLEAVAAKVLFGSEHEEPS